VISFPFVLARASGRAILAVLLTIAATAITSGQSSSSDDFANKSIEELMQVDVTSVSRKEQKLSRTPAAVYVLTQEAIQRSSATNIPDLLRIVPGVQVAQVDANRWAISVRGFNGVYSSKLLVLVDGRTVYTPTFSGVYWDQLDIPFDSIERVEVVRGPGGTVWGANAVNGVIDIITKDSRDTQGARIEAGGGSHQNGDFEGRFGGTLGSLGTYRVAGDIHSFNSLPTVSGLDGNDGWHQEHASARADLHLTSKDSLMLEADATAANGSQTVLRTGVPVFESSPQDLSSRSYSVLGRWAHSYSDHSDTSLQVYGSGYSRNDTGTTDRVGTLDFDFQNHTQFGSRNDVVWGAGYRFVSDDLTNQASEVASFATIGVFVRLSPPAKKYSLLSTFLQDEISITPTLALTVGSKFERNAFSGFQYEPSARLAWAPTDTTTWWIAVSQAVEQPSRVDTGLEGQVQPTPLFPGISMAEEYLGNPRLHSETVRDYEIGYRVMPLKNVSLDLTSFYSFYSDLQNAQLLPLTAVPQMDSSLLLTLGLQFANGLKAQDYGAEASVTWNVGPRWKLTGTYAWLQEDLTGPTAAVSPAATASLTAVFPPPYVSAIMAGLNATNLGHDTRRTGPPQQSGIQSYFDINARASFDTSVYYMGALSEIGIPAYVRLDSLLRYKFPRGVEASLVGQNLLQAAHIEFAGATQIVSTEAARSIFGRIAWSF
jgi:iron complex outermembrane receptor protein